MRSKSLMAVTAMSFLALAACSSASKTAVVKPSSDPISRAMAGGEYQTAIGLLKASYDKDPGSKKLAARYVGTVEEIKKAADGARGRGEFGQAERSYEALLANWTGFSGFAAGLTFKKADVQAGLRDCRVGLCAARSRAEMEAGSYDKAMAVYQAALKDFPGDASLKSGYAAVVGDLKTAGERAFAAGDHARAGRIDWLLLKNLTSLEKLGVAGGLNRKGLDTTIKNCSTILKNRGLEEYRKGNLEKAISIWNSLLAFDPQNVEINKAVETARAQLGRIKSLSPGGNGGRR